MSDKEETVFPPIGLNFSLRSEYERQQKQLAGVQAAVEMFNARIGTLESQMQNVTAGLGNNVNSGTQYVSGDVGYLTIAGVFALLIVAIIGYYKKAISIHKSTSLILASTHNDEEARELSATAPPKVQMEVKKTLDTKNGSSGG